MAQITENNHFWGSDVVVCSRCGNLVDSAGATLKRCEGRVQVERRGTVQAEESTSPVETTILDLSLAGARIRHGGVPLRKGAHIVLEVEEVTIPARLVWSRHLAKGEYIAGLKFDRTLGKKSFLILAAASRLFYGKACVCDRQT